MHRQILLSLQHTTVNDQLLLTPSTHTLERADLQILLVLVEQQLIILLHALIISAQAASGLNAAHGEVVAGGLGWLHDALRWRTGETLLGHLVLLKLKQLLPRIHHNTVLVNIIKLPAPFSLLLVILVDVGEVLVVSSLPLLLNTR